MVNNSGIPLKWKKAKIIMIPKKEYNGTLLAIKALLPYLNFYNFNFGTYEMVL